jgi:polyisoprenoid-binding protein YceI
VPLRSGRYALGPNDGTLLVMTGREGAAARMGHDLTLLATSWSATVTVDIEHPARSKVRATVESGSLVVREARGGAVGLRESQREEIERIMRSQVLRSERHPAISFRSTSVEGDGKRALVTGNLTIRRRTRAVVLELRVAPTASPRIRARASIIQTEFGIKPYSALLGALRVTDVVEVAVDVRLPRR